MQMWIWCGGKYIENEEQSYKQTPFRKSYRKQGMRETGDTTTKTFIHDNGVDGTKSHGMYKKLFSPIYVQ